MTWLGAAQVILIALSLSASAQSPVDDILKLIPSDAQAAIVIPNLKSTSDQITQCLEGMDRSNLLLGSRPIDQAKSTTGFNVGINDAGCFAIIFTANDPAKIEEPPQPAFLVPVNDAEAFLQGNFPSHEGDAYKLSSGRILYTKSLGAHVLLSENQIVTREYQPKDGIGDSLKSTLGERGEALLASGKVFVFVKQNGFRRVLTAMKAEAATTGQLLPGIAVAGFALLENLDAGLVVIDFDPLGLVTQSVARFMPGTPMDALTAGGKGKGADLARLPNKPFYFATSVDMAGLGGANVMRDGMKALNLPELPEWLTQSESVQFAAYPSPAGLSGGLLNDSAVILRTPQPAAAQAFLKQQMLAMQDSTDGITRTVKWEDNKKVSDAIGAADAYEVKITNVPPEMAQVKMISQLTFGAAGWRGFVREANNSIIMTFSQRPAVLEAAIQASEPGAANEPQGLAASSVIKTMRAMMPAQRDLEFYLNVGQLGQLVKHIASSFAAFGEIKIPELDAGLPPIGFALDVNNHLIETSTIVPSGVLAVMLDEAMQLKAGGGGGGAVQPKNDEP